MLSREQRILGELLLARRHLTEAELERLSRQAAARPDGSLAQLLVENGTLLADDAKALTREAHAMRAAVEPHLRPGDLLGEFRLVRELGRGGMGVVYEAVQEPLGRKVALKVRMGMLRPDEVQVVRFLREARAAARLDHPGIVSVFASGEAAGSLYYAMELVDGKPLDELVKDSPLAPLEAASIVAGVAHALAHAHSLGLVHRDVKPANILVDGDGRPRLTDFGLVRELGASALTLPQTALGTPAFMSPEQARGEPVTPAGDIYGLGAVLYFLLTARAPYPEGLPSVVLHRVLTETHTPLETVRPDLAADLVAICERALARRAAERFPTATALALALEAFVRGDKPAAPRHRWRSRRVVAGAAVLVALILTAAGLWRVAVAPGGGGRLLSRGPVHVVRGDSDGGQGVALSADGNWVAWGAGVAGQSALRLGRVGAASDEWRAPATASPAGWPLFAPDGRHLAFTGVEPGSGLWLMNLATRSLSVQRVAGVPRWWSADGHQIGLVEDKGARRLWGNPRPDELGLLTVDIRSGKVESLPAVHGASLAWSHDGRWVAFLAGRRTGELDVWIRGARGGEPVRVTSSGSQRWNLAWSPDGYLYFDGVIAEQVALFRVAIDPATGKAVGPPERMGREFLAADLELAFASGGGRVALRAPAPRESLLRLDLDPDARVVGWANVFAAPELQHVHHPDLAPDGEQLVYTSSVDRRLRRIDLRATAGRPLSGDGDLACESPRWSPDGSRIAFHAPYRGRMAIWSVAADGSGLVRHAELPGADAVEPVWSPDGGEIAFSVRGAGAYRVDVRRGSAAAAAVVPLTPGGCPDFEPSSWSRDGAAIAGSADGVFVHRLGSGLCERITSFGSRPVWLRDGQRLLFVDQDTLYLVDARSGTPRPIFSTAPFALSPILSVSGDDGQVYGVVTSTPRDILIYDLSRKGARFALSPNNLE